MQAARKKKYTAMLRRELQEYRNSFVLTPLVVSGLLLFFIMLSVLLANRITVVGDSVVEILADDGAGSGMNISIQIEDGASSQDFVVRDERNGEVVEEEWNFSREWTFNPPRREKPPESGNVDSQEHGSLESLNPLFNALHNLFLLLLLVTSCNYLLGTFNQDRRDRSVLFWKSMPVSEWQEIATRMAVVCVLAPAIYLCVSMFTQLVSSGLAMLTVWRMDRDPVEMVLGNIDYISLFRGQLSGILIWVLWTLPLYAWLLLASSAARRSPLLLALAIPIGLIVLEELFIGTGYISNAFSHHVPHPAEDGGTALGFYFHEPGWLSLDYIGMVLGWLVCAGLLWGAAWFRKHRFES
jgi:hypothetical protein